MRGRAGPKAAPLVAWKDPDAYDAEADEGEEVDLFAPDKSVPRMRGGPPADTPAFQLSFEADGSTVRQAMAGRPWQAEGHRRSEGNACNLRKARAASSPCAGCALATLLRGLPVAS